MKAALFAFGLLFLANIGHARDPGILARENWPLAGVTWMITRPAPGAEACEPGTEPTYIGPYMWLEIYATDNYGGYPTTETQVAEVEVPQSGIVRWAYPMRPGTTAWVRCRTRSEVYSRHLDPTGSFFVTDTVMVYGCWSALSRVSVPEWATRWGTIDDVPAMFR